MATYLCQVKYSAAAYKGMMTQPSDRQAASKAMLESLGIKTISMYYSMSISGIVCILECTEEQLAAAGMLMYASGGFTSIESTELQPMDLLNRGMKTAAEFAGKYQAPN